MMVFLRRATLGGGRRPFFQSDARRSAAKTLARIMEAVGHPSSAAKRARFSTSYGGGGGGGVGSTNEGGAVETFELSSSSVLKLQRGDITKWFVDGSTDAIVNAANERLQRGGGVDGAIHRAAGSELQAACLDIPEVRPGVRCPTGAARLTPAFRLPVSSIIHTVGPMYDYDKQPEVSLRNAYWNSLKLAKDNKIKYIAFPSISCGVYRFPLKEASEIAISTIKEFPDDFNEIHFVLLEEDVYKAWFKSAQQLL